MRLKIHSFIGIFALLLAGFAGSLSSDTAASSPLVATTNVTNVDRNHPPAVVAVSYRTSAFSSFTNSVTDAAIQDRSSVSAVPDVDIWTMLVAILGLISLRLWHGGKKRLPVIQ